MPTALRLNNGPVEPAGKYRLVEPFKGYSYVVIAPEAATNETKVYASSEEEGVGAIADPDKPRQLLALETFPEVLSCAEALQEIGYQAS